MDKRYKDIYTELTLLGKGGFGSIYQVCLKDDQNSFFVAKKIYLN